MLVKLISNNYKEYLSLLFTLAIILLLSSKANAEPRTFDVFSINTNKSTSIKIQPNNKINNNTSIVTWFEKFDELRDQYSAKDSDKAILTRPLMQQVERVQQWTNTANKVSKNYLLLSKAIKNLPVPAGMSDVKEYRDLMADWYSDAAQVYIDLIRPRPPARTIEDLQEQLDAIKKRSESLASNISNLKAMDNSLRQQYNVHMAIQDDAIQQFVRRK